MCAGITVLCLHRLRTDTSGKTGPVPTRRLQWVAWQADVNTGAEAGFAACAFAATAGLTSEVGSNGWERAPAKWHPRPAAGWGSYPAVCYAAINGPRRVAKCVFDMTSNILIYACFDLKELCHQRDFKN